MWRLRYENKPTNNNNTREWKKKTICPAFIPLFSFSLPHFFALYTEGPRIHQSGVAAISSGQFRVRVVHASHHRVAVHREPEQQLHITSSHSSAPHKQPQHAVVKFQWMVRVKKKNNNNNDKSRRTHEKNCEKKRLQYFKGELKKKKTSWNHKKRLY